MASIVLRHSIGGRWEPREPDDSGSARKALPRDPAELVLMVPCGQCWQVPGKPCSNWGFVQEPRRANHLARYGRAHRRGLISLEVLAGILVGLEDEGDNSQMIPDDFVESDDGHTSEP